MKTEVYKEAKKPELLKSGMEFFRQETEPFAVATIAHVHDAVEMLLVTEGSFDVRVDQRECKIGVGDLVLFRSNCIHTVTAGGEEKNSYFVFKVDTSFIFSLFPSESAGRYTLHLAMPSEKAKFLWREEELLKTEILESFGRLAAETASPSVTHELAMRAYALCAISGIIRELEELSSAEEPTSSPVYEQIYKSTVFVNAHFSEDITARDMSRRLGMSYSYFSRMFMRITGTSFRKYLNSVRIRKAEELLISGRESVTEVAALCGFNNVSHFIATYKNIKGRTPHKSRKEI